MRLVLTLAATLVVAGCGGGSEPPASPAAPAEAAEPDAVQLAGETLDGKRISLADFRGRPVLVNVWSSW